LPPSGWLIKSVRTRPAPAAAWLSRGVIDPKVRLPTAVPSTMSVRERHQLVITIGIDPHKSSLTAVAVEPHGHTHPPIRLVVDQNAPAALLAWAAQWPDRQWAVEGATGLGRGIAQQLVTIGEVVLDVPAKLAARARLLGSSSARKTDVADAISVAAVAQHNRRLNRVQVEDHNTIMRLLTERRDDLVAEHTRWINRLHVLLRDLRPGGAEPRLDTADASALLTKIRPVTAADHQRKQIARDIVRDLKRHEASIKELEKQLRAAVTASGTTLTQIQGIGFLTAAKILALTGDIKRFPNQDHYASYAGTAPINVSSGEQQTHRLSRRGNRQLNAAVHVAAITQARDPGPGRDHYRRKIAEHKTVKEARRSLKRRISNAIYRRILADQQRQQPQAA
jgi:transposase